MALGGSNMRLLGWRLALLLGTVLLGVSSAEKRQEETAKPHVLLFTMPTRGHVNPLLGLGEELAARGCRVTFPIASDLMHMVEGFNVEAMPIDMEVSKTTSVAHRLERQERKDSVGFLTQMMETLGRFVSLSQPIADVLRENWAEHPESIPDIMVVDFGSISGALLAEQHDIPVVINNPGMVFANHKLVDALFVPAPMSGLPMRQNLLERLKNLLFYFGGIVFDTVGGAVIDEHRVALGLPRRWSLRQCAKMNAILSNTVFGLEYPRPVLPNIYLTGPMVPKTTQRMSDELQEWCDTHRDVIYVSFGTQAVLNLNQTHALVGAFESMDQPVLWSLALNIREYYGISDSDMPPNVRLEPFVPQRLVLEHPNVVLFYTHGGANSAHDAMGAGVPVLCTPFFGDQPDVCRRLRDQGVGTMLSRHEMTSDAVKGALMSVYRVDSFEKKAIHLRRVFERSGGAAMAADIVLDVHEVGSEHVQLTERPAYQQYNVDYMCVFIVVVLFVRWLLCVAWRVGCRCFFGGESKVKKE